MKKPMLKSTGGTALQSISSACNSTEPNPISRGLMGRWGWRYHETIGEPDTPTSAQGFHIIRSKNGIRGDDPQAMFLSRGDNHAVARILVDGGPLGRMYTDIHIQ